MCGVLGRLSLEGPLADDGLVAAALVGLAHRGPDGQGHWRSECGRLELGHRLLSTVVERGAAQPLIDSAGVAVVANAELYDHTAYLQGADALSSDCAILGPLFRRHGLGMFEHLRGEFAFLLWDPGQRRLWAARDRFGIKPLYYARRGSTVLFASEIKALFALGVPARWNREALAIYHGAHLPPGQTLFDGVHSVPPGHVLECSGGQVHLRRYWRWPTEGAAPEDAPRAIRALLVDAVELRLRGYAASGTYLSGGLDSTALLGIRRALGERRSIALTVTFPNTPLDEAPIARRTAAALDAELIEVPCDAQTLAANLVPSVLAAEMPCTNAHGAAKFRLAAHARAAGLKVVLTGEGADEIFMGYRHFQRPPCNGAPSWLSLDAESPWHSFYDGAPPVDPTHACGRLIHALTELESGPSSAAASSAWIWSRTVLPNYLLRTLGDGVEMGNGIEGRQPFLDHHLAELAIPLEVSHNVQGAYTKVLLRRAVAPFVPREVLQGPKRPFFCPPARGALREHLVDLVTTGAPEIAAFDGEAVHRALPALVDAGAEAEPLLFELASLAILQRAFGCR